MSRQHTKLKFEIKRPLAIEYFTELPDGSLPSLVLEDVDLLFVHIAIYFRTQDIF